MVNSIFFYPVAGSLDVASIERFLMQQADTLLDPLGTGGIYLVCGLPEAREVYRDQRLARPSELPYVVLVTVKAEYVNVFQEYDGEDELRSARNIVRWLLEHTQCRVQDEYRNDRNDWSERVAQQGVGILYPEKLQ